MLHTNYTLGGPKVWKFTPREGVKYEYLDPGRGLGFKYEYLDPGKGWSMNIYTQGKAEV